MNAELFRGRGGQIIRPYQYVQRWPGDFLHVEELFLFGNKGMVKAMDLNDSLHGVIEVQVDELAVVSEGSCSFLNGSGFVGG